MVTDEQHLGCRVLVQGATVLICAAFVIAILAHHVGFDDLRTALLAGFGAMLTLCFAPSPEMDE